MTAIHETAYPRTRSNPTDRELNELFTPTPADIAFARRHTKSAVSRLGLLVLLTPCHISRLIFVGMRKLEHEPQQDLIQRLERGAT
jgi:Domain of unknown function (DUF4158)